MTNGVLPYDNDDHFANTKNPEANSYCPNNNPFITFAGRQWWINYHWSQKDGTYVYGDDGNFQSIFNPKIIERAGDAVRLWIRRPANPNQAWQTSEIVLTQKLGYGRYLVTARADVGSFSNLDPNAVFGAFTYQYSNAPPDNGLNIHRELDMLEVLRGGNSNAQFTLQPYTFQPTPWDPFTIPPTTPVITAVLDWGIYGPARGAEFALYLGDYTLDTLPPLSNAFRSWAPRIKNSKWEALIPSYTATSCPRFHINLWLMNGRAPASEQSVTVTRFQFKSQ
jgi:hypothetical protein